MKSFLISILSLAILLGMAACDDNKVNEDYIEHVSYLTGTYSNHDESNKNKLSLKYNEVELEKKEAVFYTSGKEIKIGKIILSNVIDGEKETIIDKIPLELNEEEGRLYFEGSYTTKSSKEINYSGYITLGFLSIQLSDK